VSQEHKLRVPINEFFDKPRAGNAIHFNFLARKPFHKLDSCVGVAFAIVGLLLLRKSFPNLPSSVGLRGIPRIVSISVMM
jgi:hypothetical protein